MTGAAFSCWQRLTASAVDDCDAGWVAGADEALLLVLRQSNLGRRQLARHLALEVTPALMSLRAIDVINTLPQCDWVLEPGAALRSRIADLGCLALAPGVRRLVDRRAVRELRQAIGGRRYDWLMATDPSGEERISEVCQLKGWRLVDRCLGDRSAFVHLVERRGLHELGGALTGAPDLLRERIELLYAPDTRDGVADAWLPPGRALQLMREGGSDDSAPIVACPIDSGPIDSAPSIATAQAV